MSANRGRLGEYAFWQWRDYALGPMIWTILATALIGAMPLIALNVHASELRGSPEQKAMMLSGAYENLIGMLSLIGAFLAASRFVARDRSPGLTRFLFAKPIGVTQYYLQAWILRGVTVVALALIAAMLVNANMFAVDMGRSVASVAAAVVLIAGVGFLLSVATAQDTLLLVMVYLVPDLIESLQSLYPGAKGVLNALLTVMPPMHKLDELRHGLLASTPVDTGLLLHVVLYGLGCVALATFLVRRMPLVR